MRKGWSCWGVTRHGLPAPNAITMNTAFQPRHAVVTGANRGLGFEVVRLLVADGVRVFACARGADAEVWRSLAGLPGQVVPVPLDVTDEAQVSAMARTVSDATGGELDLLVNNAGIYADAGMTADQLDPSDLESMLRTNVIGCHRVLLALKPLLVRAPAARVVQVSSRRGSLSLKFNPDSGDLTDHEGAGYSTSKAALNMLSLAWAAALRGSNVRLSIVSPGWCRTAMGGGDADLSAADGARLILDGLKQRHGSFTGGGEAIPW